MNLLKNTVLLVSAASLMLLSACGRNMQGDVYTSSSSVGKVVYGTVVSARPVTIKDNESLKGSGLGGIAGGIAGGVGGSEIGKGTGSAIGAIGGALAGAMIGAVAEDQLSTSNGFEYIVELDAPKTPKSIAIQKKEKINISTGKNSVESDVMDAAMPEETASDAISVIQQDDVAIEEGSRVMVIYRDDRARIVPSHRR